MAKVYLDRDSHVSFFIWDQPILNIIDMDKYLKLIDIPDELLLEYTDMMEQYSRLQEKLRKYYEVERLTNKTN